MEIKLDCTTCASKTCCINYEGVFLRPEEAYWIRLKYPNAKNITISKRDNENGKERDFLHFIKGKGCPFLTPNLKCSIYDNRPKVCYWYPCDLREYKYSGTPKWKLDMNCEWVYKNYDRIKDFLPSLEPPEDPTKEPDRRLFRIKTDFMCEIFGFMRDIPRGNKYAKELIKIW